MENRELYDLRDLAEVWHQDDQEVEAEVTLAISGLATTLTGLALPTPADLAEWASNYEPTLIADWYFEDHARDLAEDLGLDRETAWPYSFIDWPAAAAALQLDYTEVELDGHTYWIRA